jgi:REP element-mobilizing transposase RayT
MARKPRIEFAGALYHMLVRGNHKQTVFKDRFDFLKYLEGLFKYKERYHACIFSYVLMSNHVHLLIETKETPLSKIMQGIHQSYTVYFNRKYGTVGHLFQARYKAILCDRDAYLLSLLKYIHLNPARAHIVENPKDYEWSSHNAYARKKADKVLAETEQVLRIFSVDEKRGCLQNC